MRKVRLLDVEGGGELYSYMASDAPSVGDFISVTPRCSTSFPDRHYRVLSVRRHLRDGLGMEFKVDVWVMTEAWSVDDDTARVEAEAARDLFLKRLK